VVGISRGQPSNLVISFDDCDCRMSQGWAGSSKRVMKFILNDLGLLDLVSCIQSKGAIVDNLCMHNFSVSSLRR
jgi:hypothetical protein